MRRYLRDQGPAISATLAMEAELDNTGLVSALLKGDIAKGRVERCGNHFAWNHAWDEQHAEDIRQAVALLRRSGYSIKPPTTKL